MINLFFFSFFLFLNTIFVKGNSKPNFIVLLADDLGYGDLSYNGHPTIYTPNIDQLARNGMILTTWYSGFHICTPSRASLLTGRLPVRSGCAGYWQGNVFPPGAVGGLPHSEITFAQSLKQVGYQTKIIGKWHLGQRQEYLPLNYGFDEYYGIPYSVDMGSTPWDNVSAAVGPPLPLVQNFTIIEQPVDLSTLTKRYAEEAIEWIQRNAQQQQPFLLYFPLSHMHTPDFVSELYCNTSIRGRFGDAIIEMDWAIGQVMNAIQNNNISENTMTFFTSDNGPWLARKLAGGSPGLFYEGKHTTWEGGIRMPGLAHWPGKISAGSRSSEIVTSYDIFPTILAISNISLPDDRIIDGKDMSDIIFNNGVTQHDCIYIYGGTRGACLHKDRYNSCPGVFAVRCNQYKAHYAIMYTNVSAQVLNTPLLYNIEVDPSEQHPIWPTNVDYNSTIEYITNKKKEHEETVPNNITNQILLGWSKHFFLCCDPNSQQKYPNYPNCTCNPENWNQFTCDPVCYDLDECGNNDQQQQQQQRIKTLSQLPEWANNEMFIEKPDDILI